MKPLLGNTLIENSAMSNTKVALLFENDQRGVTSFAFTGTFPIPSWAW